MPHVRTIVMLLVLLQPLSVFARPLFDAIQTANIEAVQRLLLRGADVNARDREGRTPLMHAARLGDIAIVQTLLARGAEVNAQDKMGGGTALIYAAINGHLEVVRVLIDRGADVNAPAGKQGTALTAAVLGCHKDVVKLLVDQKADVKVSSYRGRPLEIAARTECHEIVPLLKEGMSPRKFRFAILASPADSRVRVLNVKVPYQPGIELEEGEYQVLVEREGYEPLKRRVALTSDLFLPVTLNRKRHKLTIKTIPTDGRVSLLSIRAPYQPGMELEAGEYHIQVEGEGYEPLKRWVTLSSDLPLRVRLELKKSPPLAPGGQGLSRPRLVSVCPQLPTTLGLRDARRLRRAPGKTLAATAACPCGPSRQLTTRRAAEPSSSRHGLARPKPL